MCSWRSFFVGRNSLRVILPPCTKPIDGELVLITGSGGGLGRLFALEFTKHGAEVVLWDINKDFNNAHMKCKVPLKCFHHKSVKCPNSD
uniref:Uncharacterized protein n=1 Tax=Haplochromis burtoni TaxID=8153 RepID=A0A3Q2WHW5_HAPBU